MDVYQNGILLVPGDDYTATTGTTVVLVQSASLDDIIEMVVYDVFSVPDAVSQSAGGTFSGNVTMGGTLGVTGAFSVGSDSTITGGSRLTISNIADVNNDGIRLDDSSTDRFNNIAQDSSGNFVIQHFNGSAWNNNLTLSTGGNLTVVGDIIKSTSGTSNFAAGVNAGNSIGSGGNYNTFVGDRAGRVCSSGYNNVAIGFESLDSEIGGGASVAVGYQALLDQNTSNTNYYTAFGFQSGKSITSCQYNIIVGGLAADALTTGNENTAIGVGALGTETAGDRNVAVGNGALTTQNTTGGGDIYNTAVGYNAGTSVTTGVENTIIGGLAGDALTTGNENVAVGLASLGGDTQGKKSVAVGWGTLTAQNFTSATDVYNTAIGYAAGNDITTGQVML